MSEPTGTVRRWALYESKGVMVISANGNWVEHADHKAAMDALAAQAVALATEVLNCHGAETERHITVSMVCSSRECEFVNSEIDKRNTARLLAQALLDAQGRTS